MNGGARTVTFRGDQHDVRRLENVRQVLTIHARFVARRVLARRTDTRTIRQDPGAGAGIDTPRAHAAVMTLMPQPHSIAYGDGWLHVKGGFQVDWLGYRNSVLDRAVLRFQNDVARRTGLDVGRASAAQLRIDCRGEDNGYLTIDAREQYSLAVRDDAAVLTADGPTGVLRGLATLRQSITDVPTGLAIPMMTIDGAPRFAWRG